MATDFSSLDKLVEFGLGVGIANQMMNTMNHTIAQTAVPGVGLNPGVSCAPEVRQEVPAPKRDYYIVKDERLAGPLTESELALLVAKGIVTEDTFCWYTGLDAWKLAKDIPEVNKLLLLNI